MIRISGAASRFFPPEEPPFTEACSVFHFYFREKSTVLTPTHFKTTTDSVLLISTSICCWSCFFLLFPYSSAHSAKIHNDRSNFSEQKHH